MTGSSQSIERAFRVDVEFQSGAVTYAVETYTLLAVDEFDAKRIARGRAIDSAYYNIRVPDLGLQVRVSADDVPDPDPDPPPAAAGRLGMGCPRCLSSDIVRDAWARWDEAGQCWLLGGVRNFEACQNCAAEGAELSLWLALPAPNMARATSVASIEEYRAAVEAMPDLMGRAFRLHSAEGLTFAEVADCVAISVGDVEHLLAQALAALVRHFSGPRRH